MTKVPMVVRALLACFALLSATGAQAGDAAKGADVFHRCAICHTNTKGGPNMIGPNLFGVVGRRAASLPDYSYSAALKGAGITWTPDKLKTWVMGPGKMVPGTKMAFAGLSSPAQASDLVAYLATLK